MTTIICKQKQAAEPHKIFLIWILVAGFILRIIMCFFTGLPNLHTDTYMYFNQADAILSGKYINYAPNGYPFIISLFRLFSEGNTLINFLLWFNIVAGTLSIYFVYHIALRILENPLAALIASLLMCIYPNQLNYTRWLLTEIPSTFFILVSYYFYVKNKNLLSGIFFGISSIMRPTLFPIWIAMIFIDWITKKKIPTRIILGGAIITISTCTYSYLKTGEFAIAGNSKVNIIYSIYTFGGKIAWDAPEKHPEIKSNRDAKIAYFREAFQHPLYFIEQRLASLWQLWGPFPSTLDNSRGLLSRIIIGGENIFLIISSLYGLYWCRRKKSAIILILPVLIITFIHTMMLSLARYTVPMEPFLIILSGYGLLQIGEHLKAKYENI